MKLRDYQEKDVEFLKNNPQAGIFSEQRTGKTPVACTFLLQQGFKHSVVVCPASMQYVWKDEYEKWTGNKARVLQITGKQKFIWELNELLIVNYEKIRGTSKNPDIDKWVAKQNPDCIIIDEAHRMKGRKTQTTEALMRLGRSTNNRIALTGTPAADKPWDAWTILHWLRPDLFRSYWKFIEDYCNIVYKYGNGAHPIPVAIRKDKEVALQKLLNTFCIQHKRKDIMPWSESPEPISVRLELNKDQLKAIESIQQYFEYRHIVCFGVLDSLIRIRQICADPSILNLPGKSEKIEWLIQFIKDYPNKQILVFTNSTKFLHNIKNRLNNSNNGVVVECIYGDVPAINRKTIIDNFQTNKTNILLLQTQTVKEGLTLDNADVSIFLDTYPPASDYSQAKDRIIPTVESHVKEQELIHVMMKDSYDERLYNLVKNNISATDVINDYKNYLKERGFIQ